MNNITAVSTYNQNNKSVQIGGVVIIMGIVVSLAISIMIAIRVLQRSARNFEQFDAESAIISRTPTIPVQVIY
jgi:hypothetical protein